MSKTSVVARVLDGDRLECQIVSPQGKRLTLTGTTADVEPKSIDGAATLRGNRALVHNAWAFAKFTYLKVNLPSADEQKGAEKRSKAHREMAEWITDLADDLGRTTTGGWCSGCFTDKNHRKVRDPAGPFPAYLCTNCGSPTLPCADPRCDNMALRGRGPIRLPRYCAEHRHEIPGFEKADRKMGTLGDYQEFLEYDQPHLSRTTKLVGVALAGLATGGAAGFVAAPAIGGAVGTLLSSYSGAAASAYGLALLGGGSLAAGGLGMAGGTIVVTALGATLGSALGASVTNAYVREDKSFHIEMLQGGKGVPVVVCNGFLSESGTGWGEWQDVVTKRYPDSPVYRVHWGAKELKDLGILAGFAAMKIAGPAALKQAALAATKSGAKKLGPLAPVLLAASLAKNPWHVAKNRADKTGVVVADLLARTNAGSYVLVGHSLGARAMVVAAQTLGTKRDGPRLEAVHLSGAAIGAKSDWDTLTARVDDAVYNYHSTHDNVLKYLYAVAQAGQTAAGLNGFTPSLPKLKNIDVSAQVKRHSDYYANVKLR
jgi:Protein of unknown function (DUF726)